MKIFKRFKNLNYLTISFPHIPLQNGYTYPMAEFQGVIPQLYINEIMKNYEIKDLHSYLQFTKKTRNN
jgi:hypothetical protein